MTTRQSIKRLVKDWKATLSEETDGLRRNFGPFWQNTIGLVRSLSSSSSDTSTKVAKVGENNATWYTGSTTQVKRAKELDGAFFENISSLDWKKQSLDRHSNEVQDLPSPDEDTEEYEGDHKEVEQAVSVGPDAQQKIDKKKREELYSELLYVTINQFVGEQQKKDAPVQGELYVYGQEVFGITQDEHRELFSKIRGKKPPACHVEVTVVEAKDIEAKDANGFSDPYCMLGIVTDNSFDRKLKRKTSKTRTVTEQLEDELIKTTSVRKKTLNPKWNETVTLKVNDILNETLHLDMWDQDEDSAFLDKDNTITQIRGVAGMGRFLKQVVQSSRKCSGSSSMDDFLGFVEFPIKDIPSSGIDQWFPLQARSAKSRTKGDCHLVIRLVGKVSKNSAESSVSRLETFGALLKAFLVFDGNHPEELDDVDTSGQLSGFARWILHQYVIQNNISLLQRAVVEWEVYSSYHQTQPLKYSFLAELLSSITYNWKTGGLSLADKETFHQSLELFVEYCVSLLKDHRALYPAVESSKLSRLANMLTCLKEIGQIPHYYQSRSSSIGEDIGAIVKISAERWYQMQYAWHEPKDPTQTGAILALVSFSELIVVDLLKAVKFYSKIFKEVDVDYFSITYCALETLLASDMRGSITKMDPQTLHLEVGDVDLGTQLFSLYMAAREVVDYRQYLPISDTHEFAFDSCHLWFKKFIDFWLNVARKKAEVRIRKAVEIDQAVAVDSSVKYSTSAVDVTCCFYQLCQFWKSLRWPDPTGNYLFVTKLTDDICDAARFYGGELETKLKANDFYDDNPSYFGVSESLCITLNNLAYTQQWLDELDVHLDWASIITGMRNAHSDREAKKCEETLRQFSENAQDVLLTKIDEIIHHIGEKMSVDLRKFVADVVDQDESVDMSAAMDPLLSYLERSLRIFYSTLVRPVFDRTLLHLWNQVVDNIISIIGGDKGRPHMFYHRLNKVLEVLIEFFCADGIGIPLDQMMTSSVKSLQDKLLLCQLSTEELIQEYYAEKIQEGSNEPATLGHLSLRMFYDLKNQNLHVELLNGRNLPPLDSNGYCDPYVRLMLCPRHLFPNAIVERTDVHKKTLFPLFDAKFQFAVPVESCKRPGAHLQLTVFDYDVLTDDMAGQVMATLNYVPGLNEEIPATFSGIEQVMLPLFRPKPDGKYFGILQARSDELAMKFVKERFDLYQKLVLVQDKIARRTSSVS